MRRTRFSFIALFAIVAMSSVYAYQSHYGPSGVTHYDKAKSYGGYTLFTPLRPGPPPDFKNNATYLIDMEGNVVKSWPLPNNGTPLRSTSICSTTGIFFVASATTDGITNGKPRGREPIPARQPRTLPDCRSSTGTAT